MESNVIEDFECSLAFSNAPKLQKLFNFPFLIRSLYLRLLNFGYDRFQTTRKVQGKTFFDLPIQLILPEVVSSAIYRCGFIDFEVDLIRFILRYLKPGMTFLDIGAHIGFYSLLASYMVGEKGYVHSFEPTKSIFSLLKENAAVRDNIVTNNSAVWSQNSDIPFNDYGIKYSAFNSTFVARLSEQDRQKLFVEKTNTYTIQTVSIDSYVEQTGLLPDFVKIDAESAEYEILQGMCETLSEVKPILMLEVGDLGSDDAISTSRILVEYLLDRGYQAFELKSGNIQLHSILRRYEYANLFFIHNSKTDAIGITS